MNAIQRKMINIPSYYEKCLNVSAYTFHVNFLFDFPFHPLVSLGRLLNSLGNYRESDIHPWARVFKSVYDDPADGCRHGKHSLHYL